MQSNPSSTDGRSTADSERPTHQGAEVLLGERVEIESGATVGRLYDDEAGPTSIGDDVVIRSGTIVYADVELGPGCATGHNAIVREHTQVGAGTLIGTGTVLDGRLEVGADVSIQTGVYVPPETTIGDRVFLGPRAVLTNDPYPLRVDVGLEGPTIETDATIGANATVMPGVTVGEGAFVAGGAVVTKDVPPWTLSIGVPAASRPLPEQLQRGNHLA